MAQKIKLKRSLTATTAPELELGEVALQLLDGSEKMYIKNSVGDVVDFITSEQVDAKIAVNTKEVSDLAAALETLDGKVDANETDIEAKMTALSTLVGENETDIEGKMTALTGRVTTAENTLDALGKTVEANKTAIEETVADLTDRVAANESGITANGQAIQTNAEGIQANVEAISALTETVATNKEAIEKTVDELTDTVEANKTAIEGTVETLTGRVAANESGITANGQAIQANADAITALTSTVATNKEAIEKTVSDLNAVVTGNTSEINAVKGRMTTAEGKIQTLEAAVGEGGSVETQIEAAVSGLTQTINTLDSKLQGNIDGVAADLSGHTGNADIHVTTADKARWDAAAGDATDYVDSLLGTGFTTANTVTAQLAAEVAERAKQDGLLADRIKVYEDNKATYDNAVSRLDFFLDNKEIDDTVNSLHEIAEWMKGDGVDATELSQAIAAEAALRDAADKAINDKIGAGFEGSTLTAEITAAQTTAAQGVADAATAQAQADKGVADAATAQAQADKGVADAATAQAAANAAQKDVDDLEGVVETLDGETVKAAEAKFANNVVKVATFAENKLTFDFSEIVLDGGEY